NFRPVRHFRSYLESNSPGGQLCCSLPACSHMNYIVQLAGGRAIFLWSFLLIDQKKADNFLRIESPQQMAIVSKSFWTRMVVNDQH
ncbi:MAG: hypothetical protein K1X85_02380, partial [Ignavibacteria bacterium]|nr:hypothetical protein [Ignavibacteria bacterium]